MGGAPGAAPAHVFIDYERWLNGQLELLRPDRVYAEDQFMPNNSFAAQRLYGLRAYTQAVVEKHRLPLLWVPTNTLAKFMTGRGGWRNSEDKKRATIAACRRMGFYPDDDNEGDALSVFFYAEALIDPLTPRAAGPIFA